MKAKAWFGLGIALTVVAVGALLLVGLFLGARLWMNRSYGHMPMVGVLGDNRVQAAAEPGQSEPQGGAAKAYTSQAVEDAFDAYLAQFDDGDLQIAEIMAFENNYYAIINDSSTGAAVMELLLDRTTGVVGPEMGPNMMWNLNGLHHGSGMMYGGMMSGQWQDPSANQLSKQQAIRIAQNWLNTHQPGVQADDHAVAFPGYYTLHTMKDGQIQGMLSVHADTGQVWYHDWHGAFQGMVLGEDEH